MYSLKTSVIRLILIVYLEVEGGGVTKYRKHSRFNLRQNRPILLNHKTCLSSVEERRGKYFLQREGGESHHKYVQSGRREKWSTKREKRSLHNSSKVT